jgi:hypothetical protein
MSTSLPTTLDSWGLAGQTGRVLIAEFDTMFRRIL